MADTKAVISQYADYYHESDFLPPPPGWVEIESGMPGVTRAWIPPKEDDHGRDQT
jgi:hypothetical protein